MKSSLNILIPNYNGINLLKKHLPSAVKHSHGSEIIIIDDASNDGSVSWVSSKHPSIKLIVNKNNLGFARSVNLGFHHSSSELVLLLNNDVTINAKTIPTLTGHFSDPKLFAVGSKEQLPDGSVRGRSNGAFAKGLFTHSSGNSKEEGNTMWAFAASSMYRKSLWNQLGGFDPLFKPAYYEDIDICYRAWKAGYKCHFDPKASVNHDSESTMSQVLGNKKQIYAFKNQLLFTWKNITSFPLLSKHVFWLPYHLIFTSIRSKGAFFIGFLLALLQLPALFISKATSKTNFKLTDQELFALFS